MKKRIFTLGLLIVSGFLRLQAQSFDTEFGKNRVQFNDDFKYWSQYESDNFIVYWYGKGKNVAHTIIQMAELDHDYIRKQIEHRISDKIEILVYVDLADIKQSNIGGEEIFNSASGETKILGSKMLVYFDGNHQRLREKIREGIASVYLTSMLFGSNFQEVVQNAVLLDLPAWYKPGFVSYAGNSWNIYIEDELRDILERKPEFYNFEKLAQKHARVAGHSMWYYLRTNYGKSTVSNLLYLTRITRNFEKSVEFVLNTPLKQIYNEWSAYYRSRFAIESGKFADFDDHEVKLKNKKYNPFSALCPNPSGSLLLYAVNQLGKSTVFLYDTKTRKSKKVFSHGFKNRFQEPDYEYPHLAWNDEGSAFYITVARRDKIFLRKYQVQDLKFVEQELPAEFQRIFQVSYIDNRYLLLNAAVDGFSDLFIYDTKQRESLALTGDFYDDLDARIVPYQGGKAILFSSNRTAEHILPMKLDTVLPIANFDIFLYPLPKITDKFDLKSIPRTVERLTDTPDDNERYPFLDGENYLYYLAGSSGIVNTHARNLAGGNSYPVSNYARSIIRHAVSSSGVYFYTTYHLGEYKVFERRNGLKKQTAPFTTNLIKAKNIQPETQEIKPEVVYAEIPDHLKFQSVFPDVSLPISIANPGQNTQIPVHESTDELYTSGPGIKPIQNVGITAAGLRFRVDKLTARMDNEVLFEGLELAQGQNNQVNQLPLGFLTKAGFTDIFEDYRLEAGMRLSTNLDGIEYFLTFDNHKRLLDQRWALYLRNQTEKSNIEFIPPLKSRKQTLIGLYNVRYPLDIHQSFRATASLRFDKQYFKATEIATLSEPAIYEKRLGLKLEYVFDNSYQYALNILHGTRMKVYLEAHNQFNLEWSNGLNADLSKGFTSVAGMDARHYIPVLTHSILALRASSAFSFGSKPNIYYLGGTNNSLFPSYDESVSIPTDRDFAFKSNAPHLRGFKSNIRNGSTYALMNAEMRFPIFMYLLGKDRGASFFRNFQVIGFLDAGLAWYGSGPYSKENPLNSVQIDGVLIDLDIQYFRDPVVFGYGWGVRTQLLGYFIRLDVAKGVETKQSLPTRYHLGIGLDF
ncbi:MAG: hypothetical protein IPN29_04050 [Saprospiraceae bacterium]|nr:hypothetical protein [Saprospiraceae bacterium]